MKNRYKMIGHIGQSVFISGFLVPVYQKGEKLYFHKLSKDDKSIIEFNILNKNLDKDSDFQSVLDGPEKVVGSSSLFVLKLDSNIVYGSYDEPEFSRQAQRIIRDKPGVFKIIEKLVS